MKQHFLPEETKRLLCPEDMGLVYCSVQRIEVAGEVKLRRGGALPDLHSRCRCF